MRRDVEVALFALKTPKIENSNFQYQPLLLHKTSEVVFLCDNWTARLFNI